MSFSARHTAPGQAAQRRRAVTVAQRPAPYSISPARRTARILLAARKVQDQLRRIETSAEERGVVLEWNHDANGLREWHWPTHDTLPRLGSYVAASGLKTFLALRGISAPVCLHGRDGFLTREECISKLVAESVRGTKHYKFVCKHHLEDDDCFYQASLDRSPAMALQRRVLNPGFVFDAPPEYLYTYGDYIDVDEEDHAPVTAPGLSAFARETPDMPAQAVNSARLVETRALTALNSAGGLHVDFLPALHRLLQQCKYCDIVALPAAMRDHIRTGVCNRFVYEAEEGAASGSGSSAASGSGSGSSAA